MSNNIIQPNEDLINHYLKNHARSSVKNPLNTLSDNRLTNL